jgi:AraC-like DNA-binding protein
MEPSFNSWTVFFLAAAIQGVFLSFMIFLRRSQTNHLLGALIVTFSLCLLYYVGFWTRYNSLLPWQIGIAEGLTYTFGPLLFFYVRSNRKKTYFNALHLIPFLVFAVYFLIFPLFPSGSRFLIQTTQSVIQNLHLAIYTFLILKFTYANQGFSNGALKLYNWRKKISWAFAGYTFSFLSYFILVWTGTLKIEYDYMISVMSAFFIYFIGYHGFQHQEIFRLFEAGRYEKSALTSTASSAILATLRHHMETERPFLDSSLRLTDLADSLNFPQHYISQVINDLGGKNFADFINGYRIEEAKRLLLDEQKKILHIAFDSGFNNKASFNNAFKRFTGMAPSEFRDHQSVMA